MNINGYAVTSESTIDGVLDVLKGEQSQIHQSLRHCDDLSRSLALARQLLEISECIDELDSERIQRLKELLANSSRTIEVAADEQGFLFKELEMRGVLRLICDQDEELDESVFNDLQRFQTKFRDVEGSRDTINELGLYTIEVTNSRHSFSIKVWIVPTPNS